MDSARVCACSRLGTWRDSRESWLIENLLLRIQKHWPELSWLRVGDTRYIPFGSSHTCGIQRRQLQWRKKQRASSAYSSIEAATLLMFKQEHTSFEVIRPASISVLMNLHIDGVQTQEQASPMNIVFAHESYVARHRWELWGSRLTPHSDDRWSKKSIRHHQLSRVSWTCFAWAVGVS